MKYASTPSLANALAVFAGPPPTTATCLLSYGIKSIKLINKDFIDGNFMELWNYSGPVLFLIMSDPDQMYLPKIMSKFLSDGTIVSRPLHDMYPKLSSKIEAKVFKYLPSNLLPTDFE
jgi:hypothetical protein